MFSLFKRKINLPVVDSNRADFGTLVMTKLVFNGAKFEKYIAPVSKITQDIPKWPFNRDIDPDHVDKIKRDLLAMRHPHLIGSLKLVKSRQDGTIRLLDGQHRHLALSQIMQSRPDFVMDVEVDVYYVTDVNNDLDLDDLFRKANCNLNVKQEALPGRKVLEVITYMVQKWPKNIKTDENAGAYRPNITKRDLFKRLKFVIEASNKSAEEIMAEIVAKNESIKMIRLEELFGRSPPKKQLNIFDRARKNDFYLNLDCNRDIDWWISSLHL